MAASADDPENDHVYPLFSLDLNKRNHEIVPWLLHFNDVLDVDQLKAALYTLLDLGDWRKLGGRLRRNTEGKLEIHVPAHFSADRPPAVFFHEAILDTNIDQHPLTKSLPTPRDGTSIHRGVADIRPLIDTPHSPRNFDQLIDRNIPVLSVRVTSFKDGTLIGISWPHVLMDALGFQALLRSWSLIVAGNEAAVPPVLGVRSDALVDAVTGQNNDDKDHVIMLERQSTICLPEDTITSIAACTSRSPIVVAWEPSDRVEDQAELIITKGDLITSWVVQAIASTDPSSRPITVASALNVRFRLPSSLLPVGVYLQNMTLATYTFFSSVFARSPLRTMAQYHRQKLLEQGRAQHVLEFLRVMQQDIKTSQEPRMLFGEPNAILLQCNNLRRADIMHAADFEAAVVRPGDLSAVRTNRPGSMTHFTVANTPTNSSYLWILGKDDRDVYWLHASLKPQVWNKLEQDIAYVKRRT